MKLFFFVYLFSILQIISIKYMNTNSHIMEIKRNVVGWFEIPVDDMDRAVKFYNELFGWKIEGQPFGDNSEMAIFPADFTKDLPGAGGSLFKGPDTKTGEGGAIVYFTSTSGDCANELAKAKELGSKVIMEKFKIPDGHGFMVMITDSEGNRIAISSDK
jgi:predicted enzyme related to lactoylglutathione lyase